MKQDSQREEKMYQKLPPITYYLLTWEMLLSLNFFLSVMGKRFVVKESYHVKVLIYYEAKFKLLKLFGIHFAEEVVCFIY